MQGTFLIALLLLIPALAACITLFLKGQMSRTIVVIITAIIMIASAVGLGVFIFVNGSFQIATESCKWAGKIVTVIDAIVLFATLYFGIKFKEWKIIVPTVAQIIAVFYLEVIRGTEEPEYIINVDYLALVMLLIVSILGPIIAIFAIGYMKEHEQHKKLTRTKQHLFFAAIFLFLFAMNGICVSNNIMHLYTFWEVTTLCSFLLIGHDRTRESFKSAKLQLWINSFGGLFFAVGIIFIVNTAGTLSVSSLVASGQSTVPLLTTGLMFICCSGFVKSAQMPFHPWLLGAMVAPTPVSALLHSATMVKAGVYVIVRFSPMFAGQISGILVSMVGAFTFVSAAALALSQSNGKRVLAYSTISNLGLIIACAGLGGSEALTVAILLIIFHAFSKGLLFLCVGTVELKVGSRDIEDMFGIFTKMPYTASIMTLGMLSMVLPPFGVLMTKWLAIEASVSVPPVMILLVLGSAFTIAFWTKWLGAVTTVYKRNKPKIEDMPVSIKATLGIIAVIIPVLTAIMPQINDYVVIPAVKQLMNTGTNVWGTKGGIYAFSGSGILGGFGGILLLFGVLAAAVLFYIINSAVRKPRYIAPYACGTLSDEEGGEFYGPQDEVENVQLHNYYFTNLFGEKKLLPVLSAISAVIILIMFGVS